jgi:hypothetical protein
MFTKDYVLFKVLAFNDIRTQVFLAARQGVSPCSDHHLLSFELDREPDDSLGAM